MKKIIFTLVGISFLIFSCQNELLDLQEGSIQSAALSSSNNDCVPDLSGLEMNLPESVTVITEDPIDDDPECNAFFRLNIEAGDLAGDNITAWCADSETSLDINETVTYDVYSSSEDLSGLGNLFTNLDKFDEVNWILNQSLIGKESGITDAEGINYLYKFGHIQAAIWQLLDGTRCGDFPGGCYYLTCPTYNIWNSDDELISDEIVAAALGQDGFVPQCGQQIAIILASSTKQSLIITVDVPEKEEQCLDCEGNVTELTLQYNGDQPAEIVVKTKDEGVNGSKIVFEGNVGPGDQFTINGNDENGTFGDEIKVYVDGDYVKIKTDCSEAIGPGLIIEDIEVISGKSSNGAYLCPKVCDECEGKVNNLTLQYNGPEKANIRVETKKDGENGEKVVFEGMVEAGAEFSFTGNDKKGTLGTEITIYVNDEVNTKIHTSCSKPIGPGLMSGDFEVISGSSREGGDLCPVDTPPGGGDDCNECKGKVTRLDLTYNGLEVNPLIQVVQKKDHIIVFDNEVMDGDTFTFYGKDDKGTLGTEIIIYVNGFEAQRIHTSCSDPIGAGAVFGDFTVLGGASREGGELCPVDVPPTNTECECNGGIVSVTFTYSGDVNDLSSDDDDASFTDNGNGTVTLATFDGDKLSNPEIFVNGNNVGEIHASCSDNILGLSYGDLKVVEYVDKDGNVTSVDGCSQLPPGDDCSECDGKITRLDLQYNGSGSSIEITQKKDGQVVYDGSVSSGAEFTINGKDDKGTLGTEIIIKIDGVENQRIHTSCSVEIGAGSIFGDFAVLGGASRNGGELCPVEPDDTPPASTECDCDGKIVKMSVEYSGPNGATITVGDDEDGNNSKSWDNVQKGTILTAELGDIGNWWYWSVNGTVEAAIHTSCSDDILGNVNAHKSTFGNMGIYDDPEDDDENSRNDGTFLVTYHKDGKGNECSLDIAA